MDTDAYARRLMHRLSGLRLDRITSFLHVVTHGGFSAAAQATGLPQPNLSRHVAELERTLGVVSPPTVVTPGPTPYPLPSAMSRPDISYGGWCRADFCW